MFFVSARWAWRTADVGPTGLPTVISSIGENIDELLSNLMHQSLSRCLLRWMNFQSNADVRRNAKNRGRLTMGKEEDERINELVWHATIVNVLSAFKFYLRFLLFLQKLRRSTRYPRAWHWTGLQMGECHYDPCNNSIWSTSNIVWPESIWLDGDSETTREEIRRNWSKSNERWRWTDTVGTFHLLPHSSDC